MLHHHTWNVRHNEMKTFWIIILSIFCLSAKGQDWGAHNAVWHYSDSYFGPPFDTQYFEFSYSKDTTVNGKQSRILLEQYIGRRFVITSQILMHSDSNRVYLFDTLSKSFRLLYDFNASKGDTIKVFCRWAKVDTFIDVTVDSVSSVIINNKSHRVQHVGMCRPQEYRMNGTIIENIGWTGFMFPLHSRADPPRGGPLRCYEDSILGNYMYGLKKCDYLNPLGINSFTNDISVYPNPASKQIFIEAYDYNIATLSTLGGKVILSSSKRMLDVSSVESGLYILSIKFTDKIVHRKIVIEKE